MLTPVVYRSRDTDRLDVRLKLVFEELQTVVENVLIGRVQAGLHTVPHHMSRSGRALQLQHLSNRKKTLTLESP